MLRVECGRREEACCQVLLVTSQVGTPKSPQMAELQRLFRIILVLPDTLNQGPALEEQATALGVYVGEGGYEGRLLYTHTDRWVAASYCRYIVFRKQFIYYYDWGPNSRANWMFSSEVRTLQGQVSSRSVKVGATSRGVESANVEAGYTNHSTYCIAPGARKVLS